MVDMTAQVSLQKIQQSSVSLLVLGFVGSVVATNLNLVAKVVCKAGSPSRAWHVNPLAKVANGKGTVGGAGQCTLCGAGVGVTKVQTGFEISIHALSLSEPR